MNNKHKNKYINTVISSVISASFFDAIRARARFGLSTEVFISVEYPAPWRLSDNSISGQKHVTNKVSKAFKSKKKEFN